MDLYRIIRDLVAERDRVVQIIKSLEMMREGGTKSPRVPAAKRRGRKSMDPSARREVSERMKRYWAKRRGKQQGEQEPNL